METKNRRKPPNSFLILYKDYIHLPTPIGWEHQPPVFTGTELKEAPTPYIYKHQPEGSSNSLYLQAPT
jgi:hypothetical protein